MECILWMYFLQFISYTVILACFFLFIEDIIYIINNLQSNRHNLHAIYMLQYMSLPCQFKQRYADIAIVCPILSWANMKTLIQAFITSRFDYCNALLLDWFLIDVSLDAVLLYPPPQKTKTKKKNQDVFDVLLPIFIVIWGPSDLSCNEKLSLSLHKSL